MGYSLPRSPLSPSRLPSRVSYLSPSPRRKVKLSLTSFYYHSSSVNPAFDPRRIPPPRSSVPPLPFVSLPCAPALSRPAPAQGPLPALPCSAHPRALSLGFYPCRSVLLRPALPRPAFPCPGQPAKSPKSHHPKIRLPTRRLAISSIYPRLLLMYLRRTALNT